MFWDLCGPVDEASSDPGGSHREDTNPQTYVSPGQHHLHLFSSPLFSIQKLSLQLYLFTCSVFASFFLVFHPAQSPTCFVVFEINYVPIVPMCR